MIFMTLKIWMRRSQKEEEKERDDMRRKEGEGKRGAASKKVWLGKKIHT